MGINPGGESGIGITRRPARGVTGNPRLILDPHITALRTRLQTEIGIGPVPRQKCRREPANGVKIGSRHGQE